MDNFSGIILSCLNSFILYGNKTLSQGLNQSFILAF